MEKHFDSQRAELAETSPWDSVEKIPAAAWDCHQIGLLDSFVQILALDLAQQLVQRRTGPRYPHLISSQAEKRHLIVLN